GHKGQKQHGKVPRGFNGGQTSDEVVRGPRGFTNNFAVDLAPVNLDRIQHWIDQGRIDAARPITLRELATSRCVHGVKDGVKLLARNAAALTSPVTIVVSRASAAAIAAVEKAGGSVMTRYYTPFAVRRIMRGEMSPIASVDAVGGPLETITPMSTVVPLDAAEAEASPDAPKEVRIPELPPFKYRLPDPTGRRDIEYYRDPAHRGYLVHKVKEGEGPSLFFRRPGAKTKKTAAEAERKKDTSENKLW
ncbi:MAG: mitochondrial large ribosomal subunit protein uL15m, partial [Terriglobus roseus]|nr:mitochondrial large ribosomal subunit protein uL15m [Terriglobus roseus]